MEKITSGIGNYIEICRVNNNVILIQGERNWENDWNVSANSVGIGISEVDKFIGALVDVTHGKSPIKVGINTIRTKTRHTESYNKECIEISHKRKSIGKNEYDRVIVGISKLSDLIEAIKRVAKGDSDTTIRIAETKFM